MPLQTAQDLAQFCIPVEVIDPLSVIMPGGGVLSAQDGYESGDALTVAKSLLSQINAALVPLSPFFDTLDFAKATLDCISSIPDAILTLNPQPIVNCIVGLTEAVNKLLVLFPPIPIFLLVKGVLSVIVTALRGLSGKIRALIAHGARLANAATKAAATGNVGLAAVVECAEANFDARLRAMNQELGSLNRLIGVVNLLLELAQQDCIPAIGDIAEISEVAIDPLEAFIEFLEFVSDAIPGGIPELPVATAGQCL